MKPAFLVALSLTLSFALTAVPAAADDDDKAACADKQEGDDCTRGDGDPGTCTPDDSDDVLSCDDDASSSDDGSSGCSTGGAPGSPLVALVVGGVALALARRRRG